MAVNLSQKEIDQVVSAIRQAEEKTSAEIFAVICQRSSDYRFVGYTFFFFWIFICSTLAAVWLHWKTSHWGGQTPSSGLFATCQLAAAVSGMVLIRFIPSLPLLITPQRIAHGRAHKNAVSLFLAHGIHNTTSRHGILVFVSVDEHYAEILVDSGIEESLGRDRFLAEVEVLTDYCRKKEYAQGFAKTIGNIGASLANAFPPGEDDENELEDRLIIL